MEADTLHTSLEVVAEDDTVEVSPNDYNLDRY